MAQHLVIAFVGGAAARARLAARAGPAGHPGATSPAGGVGGAAGRRLGRARGAHGGQPAPGGLRRDRPSSAPARGRARRLVDRRGPLLARGGRRRPGAAPPGPGRAPALPAAVLGSDGGDRRLAHVEQRPVVRGPLAGRPARRRRAHARRRAAWRWRRRRWPWPGRRSCASIAGRSPTRRRWPGEARRRPLRRALVILAVCCAAMAAWSAAAGGQSRPRAPRPDPAALMARGRVLFAQGCASCHGEDLRGRPELRPVAARRRGGRGRLLPLDRAHAAGRPHRRARAHAARLPAGRHRRPRRLRRLLRRAGHPARRPGAREPRHRDGEVHRALRRLPPDRRARGHRHRRRRRPPRRHDADAARRGGPRRALPDAEVLGRGSSTRPRWTRSPATSSRSATPTTAAAGASATSGPCPRGWSRGSWPWPPCSRWRA